MFTQPHDKEVFRDSKFNKTSTAPSLSSKIHRPSDKMDKDAREQEVFRRLPAIPTILEQDKTREEERVSPPLSLNPDVEYSSAGSSSHKLIRSSMYTIPADEDLFELIGLPMLIVAQPFNDSVAVPEYRADYLYKCKECGSFPAAAQEDGLLRGQSENTCEFKCAMCGCSNEIVSECPSLKEHTVEYICEDSCAKDRSWYSSDNLPKSGMAMPSCRKWKEPCLIFMIDCSASSRGNTGYIEFMNGMRSILGSSDLSLFYRRFAIVLVNEEVSVVSDGEMGYALHVMHDVKGDYGLCAPLFIETESLTEERVTSLVQLIEGTPSSQFNIAGGVTVAVQLAAYTGGCKLMAWLGGSEYSEVPEQIAQTAVDCGVSICVFTSPHSKLSKLYKTVMSTGGSIERDGISVAVVEKIMQESFFRCAVRVVCSNGIKKRAVYSSGSSENISMISFPVMSASTAFSVSFSVEDFLKEGSSVHIQCIVEYISSMGENRVRIINISLKASRVMQQIFIGMAMDTMFCGMCKYICSDPINMVENVRKAETSMVTALSLYKRSCAKDTSPSQLVLPDTIKGLPVLMQAVLKYPKVQLGPSVKIELACELMPLPVDRTFRMFYPRLVKISSLFTVGGIDDLMGERLSMRTLDSDESYIMDTGCKTILWFGKDAVDYIDEMIQNEVVIAALERLKETYGVELKVTHCIQGELDADFIGYMVEDQMGGYPKYQEYLGSLHGKIVKK
ncbi:protein transport protein SEC24 [Nematocida ausubeli]|nr:protein transport protein SEC24 [Nematocida ausubeli]